MAQKEIESLFIFLFAEKDIDEIEFLDAWEKSVGEGILNAFYGFIEYIYFNPIVPNFGKRVFEEYYQRAPIYSMYLLKKFCNFLLSTYSEIEDLHS